MTSVGDLLIDRNNGIVSHSGQSVRLTKTEQAVLERLMRSEGSIVTSASLHASFYRDRADGDEPQDKIIDVLICKLRAKL
jgi:DNA-binding response OmpR family regulator